MLQTLDMLKEGGWPMVPIGLCSVLALAIIVERLIALRRRWPELTDPRLTRVGVRWDDEQRWLLITRGPLQIAANLSRAERRLPLGRPAAEVLAASVPGAGLSGRDVVLPPASLAVILAG